MLLATAQRTLRRMWRVWKGGKMGYSVQVFSAPKHNNWLRNFLCRAPGHPRLAVPASTGFNLQRRARTTPFSISDLQARFLVVVPEQVVVGVLASLWHEPSNAEVGSSQHRETDTRSTGRSEKRIVKRPMNRQRPVVGITLP